MSLGVPEGLRNLKIVGKTLKISTQSPFLTESFASCLHQPTILKFCSEMRAHTLTRLSCLKTFRLLRNPAVILTFCSQLNLCL